MSMTLSEDVDDVNGR